MAWADDEMALVALKEVDHDDYEDPLHSIVDWTGFGNSAGPTKVAFDPMEAPILLLHNDEDGAVDWNQGIEFYNTVRRLQKPIVMLQDVGENQGLRDEANRKDYTVRMREFFNHYLMGEPAPEWWTDGVAHLDMGTTSRSGSTWFGHRRARRRRSPREAVVGRARRLVPGSRGRVASGP